MVAKKATGFDMECYGINTSGHPVDGFKQTYPLEELSEIVCEMTIIVNILPLTEETKGLFNGELFKKFNQQAVLINVGRGASLKTDELVVALNEGRLAFAALDVFEEEPLPYDSPLWEMDNVLLTSHIAGLTPDFQNKLMKIFLDNLQSYMTNHELKVNQVELNKGY